MNCSAQIGWLLGEKSVTGRWWCVHTYNRITVGWINAGLLEEKNAQETVPKDLKRNIGSLTSLTFQPHLGHADPLLQQPRSLLAPQLRGPQAGRQHRVGQAVELPDGGPDWPAYILPALLVPLGPERAKAVVRHQTHKQLLTGRMGKKHLFVLLHLLKVWASERIWNLISPVEKTFHFKFHFRQLEKNCT